MRVFPPLHLPLRLRLLSASALLVTGALAFSGCSGEAEAPRTAAADQTGFLQPAENWVSVIMNGGGLARLPRSGGGAAPDGIVNLASVPLTRSTRTDRALTAAEEVAAAEAAFAALPPVEPASPPSWKEAQRLRAIENARAQRAAATRVAPSLPGTGDRTVHWFVQPANRPSLPPETVVAVQP